MRPCCKVQVQLHVSKKAGHPVYHLCYLKFGFSRALQDCGIEIRLGSMTRDQALNLVKIYDGQYPEEFINTYLEYYRMTKSEFDEVLDKWANKNLFRKENGKWKPLFTIE